MYAPAFELDEEQDIDPSKGHRLDGEEIGGDQARRLLAQECAPREVTSLRRRRHAAPP
jgi:hypothetical protein